MTESEALLIVGSGARRFHAVRAATVNSIRLVCEATALCGANVTVISRRQWPPSDSLSNSTTCLRCWKLAKKARLAATTPEKQADQAATEPRSASDYQRPDAPASHTRD